MINIGSDLVIKNILDGDKLSLGISEDFVHTKELMKENSISINFNLDRVYNFVRGDYIEHEGEKFILRKDCLPEEISLNEYHYNLVFEGEDMQLQDVIMFYTMQGLKEAEWTLTSDANDFMTIAIENIKRYFGNDWTLGQIAETGIENIAFDSSTVFDALTEIAETFKCEWYVQSKTINLVSKYEYGNAVALEREVSLAEINQSNENAAEYCTRLYALGSTRNIPRNYRSTGSGEFVDAIVQKRLRLPVNNGDYIDAIPGMTKPQILERVVKFDDIYPRRIGAITEIRSVDRTEDSDNPFIVYFFKDTGLEFKLDYILPGETLMLVFESGFLQGREFEVAYNDKTAEFEIINDTSNEDLTIPNEVLKPRVGDEYVLYGFDISLVSDQYIPAAEKELLQRAKEYLKEITEDNATYTCPNVPGYCYQNNIDLQIGQRVKLVSPLFMYGNKTSRVYGFTKSLYNKYICTYMIGDVPKYSRLAAMSAETQKVKDLTQAQYTETSKSLKALSYLKIAMENETIIDKGLILTTLLRLGAVSGNNWLEHAGVSGIYEGENDIAFWAGGTLEQAINLINNPEATDNVAAFAVTHDGKAIMNQAFLRGKFESNANGSRIVIDPVTRQIQLIHSTKGVVGNWSFYGNTGSSLSVFNKPSDNQNEQVQINGNTISFSIRDATNKIRNSARVGITGMQFDINLFPTKERLADLSIGEFYRDGNIIKMKIEG